MYSSRNGLFYCLKKKGSGSGQPPVKCICIDKCDACLLPSAPSDFLARLPCFLLILFHVLMFFFIVKKGCPMTMCSCHDDDLRIQCDSQISVVLTTMMTLSAWGLIKSIPHQKKSSCRHCRHRHFLLVVRSSPFSERRLIRSSSLFCRSRSPSSPAAFAD